MGNTAKVRHRRRYRGRRLIASHARMYRRLRRRFGEATVVARRQVLEAFYARVLAGAAYSTERADD